MDRQVDNPEGERMARRVMLALCAAVLVPGVAACGGSTEGAATTSTSAAQAALWNPCTEVPDDLLRQIGVDPATEEKGLAGVDQSGWEICTWAAPKYYLTIFSSDRTEQEIRNKPGNVDFEEIQIAGRGGLRYRVEGAGKALDCDTAFSAQQGSISVKVGNKPSQNGHVDPCALSARAAEYLVSEFPR
ncbi:DUF3558 domain-containing protein [Nocardia sp. bgisy134]|uniref:DUF3558 domain-containing protein n=1 Tax=Nocardia sp. bgisy134 TaxID=3413789 RepID=UPI003D727368